MPSGSVQNKPKISIKEPVLKDVSPWTSLASFPKNIHLQDQNGDEYLLLFVREHKIILFFNLFFYSLVIFLPVLIGLILSKIDTSIFDSFFDMKQFINSKWWVMINIAWFAYLFNGFFNIFFSWFYNINVLTSQRFMDIDFAGIFETRVESAALLDIEDIKDTQKGILQSIFNMGDLTVLTASGKTEFSIKNVPQAHRIRDFIMDVTVKLKDSKGGDK